MQRSKTTDDDRPRTAATPRPATIVGGSAGKNADLPPVPTGIQKLLRLAEVDAGFRRELLARRAGIASAAGVALTASEAAILGAVPAAQLEAMIGHLPPPPAGRRTFLRQTASTAVMLLGGAVLAECAGCTKGVGPETPPPTDAEAGASAPEDVPPRPEVTELPLTGGAAPDEPPPRPYEPAPPTAGVRPDPPEPPGEEPAPPRPEHNEMDTDGGISPDLREPPDAGDGSSDGEIERPGSVMVPQGIQPDMPPPRPSTRPTTTHGGVRRSTLAPERARARGKLSHEL